MKKIILCLILIFAVIGFTACNNNGPTVDQKWAMEETLLYSVTDADKGGAKVGEAKFYTTTKISDEDKSVNSETNTKMVATTIIGEVTQKTEFYVKVTNAPLVLNIKREYIDNENPENNYTLNAYHNNKDYIYTLKYPNNPSKDKSDKIKVGNSGYTDAEFLYLYIRCHDISAVPSSIKVADPFTNSVVTLACSATANNVTVATESALGSVVCDKVEINRTETPIGKGITVCYLPAKDEYIFGEGSIIKSSNFPTKIVEDNLTYLLKDYSPQK